MIKPSRIIPVYVLVAVIFASSFCSFAANGDWPQWRGPNRDGISTEKGLLQDWPAGGPPLAWKATGLGAGHSTVSISGNRIITSGDKGETSYLLAFNLADGKPLWSTKLGQAGAPGWGGFAGPRSTPTIDGELVFTVGQYGELLCANAATGKEVWRKHFDADFGGKLPEWGFSEGVLVDGDNVIITPGGSQGAIVALNKKNGTTVWRAKEFTDMAAYASIIKASIAGVPQYVQLTEASVAGIAPADGKLLWRAARKGATAVIPTPIVSGENVYVTSGYGIGCNLFKVTKEGGAFKAEEVYANKVMKNHHGGVVLLGDNIYGHSDGVGWVCQDLKSGKAVWEEKGKLGKGAAVYADGRLYLRQEDKQGTIALVEASPAGYKEHGRFDQPERTSKNSWAHPVVAGGKLYIRDQDTLLCYDVKKR